MHLASDPAFNNLISKKNTKYHLIWEKRFLHQLWLWLSSQFASIIANAEICSVPLCARYLVHASINIPMATLLMLEVSWIHGTTIKEIHFIGQKPHKQFEMIIVCTAILLCAYGVFKFKSLFIFIRGNLINITQIENRNIRSCRRYVQLPKHLFSGIEYNSLHQHGGGIFHITIRGQYCTYNNCCTVFEYHR